MPTTTNTILVADDNREFCQSLCSIIRETSWNAHAVHSPDEALAYIRHHAQTLAMIFLDVEFHHYALNGLHILEETRKHHPDIPVVMISGVSTMREVTFALQLGAQNFIGKSDVNRQAIVQMIQTEIARKEHLQSQQELRAFMNRNGIIGKSKAILTVVENIVRFGKTNLSVLLTGETGTGKSVAAKAIHAASTRRQHPFKTVDIPNTPETLFQSVLFGHTRGAFTGATEEKQGLFQAAHRGTLFLDEIGDLPLHLQPGLLLPIEQKVVRRLGSTREEEADVRIIAATDRNLPDAVRNQSFREQLFYRLRECEITLPPLRERREDIPLIAESFVQKHNEQYKQGRYLSSLAVEYLQSLEWHGNIRQLSSTVRRILETLKKDCIDVRDVLDNISPTEERYHVLPETPSSTEALANTSVTFVQPSPSSTTTFSQVQMTYNTFRDDEQEWRRQRVITSLTKTRGNISKSAAELGVSRQCLHNWINQLNIGVSAFR